MDLFRSGAATWNQNGGAWLQIGINNVWVQLSNSEKTFATG
jgi:hypothetical protein